MKNKSIKSSLLLLVGIMLCFIALTGIIGTIGMISQSSKYELMLDTAITRRELTEETKYKTMNLRRDFSVSIVQSEFYDDDAATEAEINNFKQNIESLKETLAVYEKNFTSDKSITEEARGNLRAPYEAICSEVEYITADIEEFRAACSNDDSKAVSDLFDEMGEVLISIDAEADTLNDLAVKRQEALEKEVSNLSRTILIAIIVIIIAIIVIALIIAMKMANSITKPIVKLANLSKEVAGGNFDVNMRTNDTNEVGMLANSLALLVDTFTGIVDEMSEAFKNMENGILDSRIDVSKYDGEYKIIAESINLMLESNANEIHTIINSVNEYSRGNFEFTSPRFLGQKAILHEAFDDMKAHFASMNGIVGSIINSVQEGNLDMKFDSSGYTADWKKIVDGLNELVAAIITPTRITKTTLSELAKGNFSYVADESQVKGEFKELIQNCNTTTSHLSGYISEISNVLSEMANQNLNVSIHQEYIGDFAAIKEALELIIENFNVLIKEIIVSSEQVAIGSQSIADSSIALAQGASEQASAVEELNATISTVAEAANTNTEKISESNELAKKAQENAETVNREMQEMLTAMKEISESSNNISNIIKAIDDIAFQTNILALNAAVEAARAGEHGKGFAVVADEVRTLAARSQQSAQETADLISTALEKAQQGSEIVDRTVDTIKAVTKQIENISVISEEVAKLSEAQNNSINEINIGISQIAKVVSNNTATSEESASASEELASQSEVFKNNVSKFTLK